MTDTGRDTLAAEYVIGLLEGTGLARARALAVEDKGFRREIGTWTAWLAPLLDEVEAVEPPASVWRRIESQISPAAEEPSNVVPLRRRVRVWQGMTAAATAVAASLALVLVASPQRTPAPPPQVPPQAAPAQPPMVAMLESDDGEAQMFATWDPAGQRLVIAAAEPAPSPPGRSHELWMIGADGQPVSMGVMPERDMISLAVDDQAANKLAEGVTLAVSDEPAGGSPTGSPTGPVIASGKLQRA